MRLRACVLLLACFPAGVLAACGGGKHPPTAGDDTTSGPAAGPYGSGTDSGMVSTDAGPAPKCLDFGPGPPTTDCRCTIKEGMLTVPLACGLALCTSVSPEVALCRNDGTLTYLENVPFALCTKLQPCEAGAGDAGDAAVGSQDASADDGG